MRLQKIKLAGFKSFVDPTTILFPHGLIGVVGPNGCGKSNVIDAVRWVIGEISAKHLRGDSMSDVVFNGSTSRKPVGQASVEIVFDNSDGRLGGQYATYNEISVKRQVARDGVSAYYLNGARCRRKDIMDIFLGTGIGPRSYAIIEQGMISRLVEAKPDELRDFLEEAAGISKYKERRRETENRMRHTQENLDRLNDLRDELDKRLQHLKRQAATAEKYKILKQEERMLRAQLLGLQWQALDEETRAHDKRIAAQETAVEAAVAEQRSVEADLEKQRAMQVKATDAFNEVYRRVLDAGAAIARVEETIQNLRQRREQFKATLEDEEQALSEARSHLAAEERKAEELRNALGASEPELQQLEATGAVARAELSRSEDAVQDWQGQWESLGERISEPMQAAHAERTRIEHIEERLERLRERIQRTERELNVLDPERLSQNMAGLEKQLAEEEGEQTRLEAAVHEQQVIVRDLRDHAGELSTALHAARERFQEIRGRQASLQALQQNALGKMPGGAMDWLARHGLEELPRLAEALDVEAGWERAVETVLGFHLEAVCVPGMDDPAGKLRGLSDGGVVLFDTAAAGSREGDEIPNPADMLHTKVKAPWPVHSLLAGVRVAESLDKALTLRSQLHAGGTVITPEGEWIGRTWVRVVHGSEEASGVLAREHELKSLTERQTDVQKEIETWERELQQARAQLHEGEEAHARLHAELTEAHRRDAGLKSRLSAVETELNQVRTRTAELHLGINELRTQEEAERDALRAARVRLQGFVDEAAELEIEREALGGRRDEHRRRLEAARDRWQKEQDNAYRVGLRVESMRTQIASLEQGRARDEAQLTRLESRCSELREHLSQTVAPLQEAEQSLEERLQRQQALETELKDARRYVEEVESGVRTLDQQRYNADAEVQTEREALERLRVTGQETRVRRQTVEEQISASGFELDALLRELPDDAGEQVWQDRLQAVERRISRLGPINLAAIDEYEEQSERKTYLDAQHADLTEALATLEEAIRKIDRETRTRFKETFDKVNAGLGTTFARLFGGGHAYLEMTGTDLLSTGVAVMARPPGKRNSTIHLLSGGEKALTAVALVFALFELNPAPFCLLDEVDAPLDDANVGRFCDLVKEMSERLQLLLVTHNKTTMETTHQLIGVTMNEPGVSRLVAVDVDEAVQMAAV